MHNFHSPCPLTLFRNIKFLTRAPGKMVCGAWNHSWFCWKSQLPGKGAVVKTAKRLPRINLLARFEVKKKFFSRSEGRTVFRFIFFFPFLHRTCCRSGIIWAFSSKARPSFCWCLLFSSWNPFWFRPGFLVLICNSPLGVSCSWERDVAAVLGRCDWTLLLCRGQTQPAAVLCSCDYPWMWKLQLTATLF